MSIDEDEIDYNQYNINSNYEILPENISSSSKVKSTVSTNFDNLHKNKSIDQHREEFKIVKVIYI